MQLISCRKKLLLREESLKMVTDGVSSCSSSLSSCKPPALPPLVPPPSTVLQSPPSPVPQFSRMSSRETSSRGETSASSFSSTNHREDGHWFDFQGNSSDHCRDGRQFSFQDNSTSTKGNSAELDDDWVFNLDDILADETDHYNLEPYDLDPPLPFNSKPPQSYTSETPQPYNSEPVDTLGMPRSAAFSPYPSAQNSRPSALSSKKPFRPPFLQPDKQSLNASFGRKFGKPGMFKPSETNEPPQDDAAEFRGQYEHKREMYKIFNQVSPIMCTRECIYRRMLVTMPVQTTPTARVQR